MNLRHWRHFLAIAELRSLTRAADRLGVPQPVLSREMRDLETALGVELLVRHARGVALTGRGELFRKRAEAILREIDEVPRALSGTDEPLGGKLSLGMPPSLSGIVTAEALVRFRQLFPHVQLHLREAPSIGIRDGLLARELDIGVLSTPLIEPQLALQPLVEEPMVLAGPPGCGLSPERPITTAEIAMRPLILPTRPNSTRLVVEHALESHGLAPQVVVETDNAPIGEMVRRGIGYSVLPSSFIASHRALRLSYAPIRGLWISWTVGSLRDLPLTPAAERMFALLQAVVAAQQDWPLWANKRLRQSLRREQPSRQKAEGKA